MGASSPIDTRDFKHLVGITFRQLEVFSVVFRERSYANAAAELNWTRANVKRVSQELESAVGRKLFFEEVDRTLRPTMFAEGFFNQIGPLSRSLRRLADGVRSLHDAGRTLRFGAAAGLFRGGLFADFLGKSQIADQFKACFVRIEASRFRAALLSAECDVYFGVGLSIPDRFDFVDLGLVRWQIFAGREVDGMNPAEPAALAKVEWKIARSGEPGETERLVECFRERGAGPGEILSEKQATGLTHDSSLIPSRGFVFVPDVTAKKGGADNSPWPKYRMSAILRKNHPYSELKQRISDAAKQR